MQKAAGVAYLGYIFGAYAARSVPGPCLIDLLLELGLTESAARTMLSRQTRNGALTSTRHGRLAIYQLAGSYRERFLRIRRADEPEPWSGGFQLILYDIAESRRRDRDALRERAAAVGFGAPRPGLLIGFADPAGWAQPWLNRTELFVRAGELKCSVEVATELAERAWPLARTAPRLAAFIDRLAGIRDRDARSHADAATAFGILGEVMWTYAGLYAETPNLPREIAPLDWPGNDVPAALGAVSRLLGPRASKHAYAIAEERGLAELVEPLDR